MNDAKEITIRAKAFSSQGVRSHKIAVDMLSGIVRVWDAIAGHYTTCHSLSRNAHQRIYKAVNFCK